MGDGMGADLEAAYSKLIQALQASESPLEKAKVACASIAPSQEVLTRLLRDVKNMCSTAKATFLRLLDTLLEEEGQWTAVCQNFMAANMTSLVEPFMSEGNTLDLVSKWVERLELTPSTKGKLSNLSLQASKKEEQRRRKQVHDAMEKDRESHKLLRELNWSRPPNEKGDDEFLSYYEATTRMNSSYLALMKRNQMKFFEINNRAIQMDELKKQISDETRKRQKSTSSDHKSSKRPKVEPRQDFQVFIFDIEVSFVYLDAFLRKESPPEILTIVKTLDDMITDIAKKLYFYTDLRKEVLPHLNFHSQYDNGRDLRQHMFDRDRLALRKPLPEDPECNLEKAYRARAMRDVYSAPGHLERAMKPEFMDTLVMLRADLDELAKKLNSLSASIFTLLSKRPNTAVYVLAPRSVPRTLAVCSAFGLDKFIPPTHIYSTIGVGPRWCLEDIQARHAGCPLPVKFFMCSGYEEVKADCRAFGIEFFRVRGRPEMMEFSSKFGLL